MKNIFYILVVVKFLNIYPDEKQSLVTIVLPPNGWQLKDSTELYLFIE